MQVKYKLSGRCIDACGMRSGRYLNCVADAELTCFGDSDVFKCGCGELAATGLLTALKDPDGRDTLHTIKSDYRILQPKLIHIIDGMLNMSLPILDGAVLLTVTAQMSRDGSKLEMGVVKCEVKKFTWRMALKFVTVAFSGELINSPDSATGV